MTVSRFRVAALSLFLLLALAAVLVPALGAQDVLTQNLRWTGPTTARTYTLPDADSRVVVTATATAWKIAAGTITLDGSNPSSAVTGLAAIVSCQITDRRTTTPGDDPSWLTSDTAALAGRLDVYAWKNTGGTDPTLVASTNNSDLVDYICVGS